MFKTLIALFATASFSSVFASGYGDAGCGLGSVVFGNKQGFTQVFASTTNGTFGSQTFGITSGTSNCAGAGKSAAAFIEANRTALSNDIARGQGETISALAEIYGIQNISEMSRSLKVSYMDIFKSEDSAVIELKIRTALKESQLI